MTKQPAGPRGGSSLQPALLILMLLILFLLKRAACSTVQQVDESELSPAARRALERQTTAISRLLEQVLGPERAAWSAGRAEAEARAEVAADRRLLNSLLLLQREPEVREQLEGEGKSGSKGRSQMEVAPSERRRRMPPPPAPGHLMSLDQQMTAMSQSLSTLLDDDDQGPGRLGRAYKPRTISTARGFGKRSGRRAAW